MRGLTAWLVPTCSAQSISERRARWQGALCPKLAQAELHHDLKHILLLDCKNVPGFGGRQFQKCRIYSIFVADTSLQTKAKWLKKGKIIKPPAVSPCLQFYPKALCRHLAKRSKSPMNKGFGKALQMLCMSLHALLERTRGSMLSECPCLQVQVDLPFRSSFEFKELPDEKIDQMWTSI